MSCLPIQVVKIVVAETFMQQLMHLIDRLSANWPCEKECPFLNSLFFAKSDGFNLPWPLRFFLSKPKYVKSGRLKTTHVVALLPQGCWKLEGEGDFGRSVNPIWHGRGNFYPLVLFGSDFVS